MHRPLLVALESKRQKTNKNVRSAKQARTRARRDINNFKLFCYWIFCSTISSSDLICTNLWSTATGWWCGADAAHKNLRRVIKDPKTKMNVIVSINSALKCLKLVKVHVHGHKLQSLLDFGAVSNLLSMEIRERLGIDVRDIKNQILPKRLSMHFLETKFNKSIDLVSNDFELSRSIPNLNRIIIMKSGQFRFATQQMIWIEVFRIFEKDAYRHLPEFPIYAASLRRLDWT